MPQIHELSSDESDDELYDNEQDLSGVLLGFGDVVICEEDKPEVEDTFIGGEPIWLNPESPPPSDLLLCKNCHLPLRLFLQTYALIGESLYDRVIYIFGCNKASCRRLKGSIRAIRALRKDPNVMKRREMEFKIDELKVKRDNDIIRAKKTHTKELASKIFASKESHLANPFDTSDSNPFSTSLDPFTAVDNSGKPDQKISVPQEQFNVTASDYLAFVPHLAPLKPSRRELDFELPSFPGTILYLEDEVLDPSERISPPIQSNINFKETVDAPEMETGSSFKMPEKVNTNIKEAGEIIKSLDDTTFQHFTDIISYNPTQVYRYKLNGFPLLYNTKDDVSKVFYDENGKLRDEKDFALPRPGYHPNGSRRFELQLMPQAIIDLESDDSIDILKDGMEWGTILVATDSDDFIPDTYFDENYVAYVEEWCGVQWEEQMHN
ncbi:hypothetical protein FOA43_003571 [Brettanomyces nanus]|uniref:Programmed cell death protein 2 C-terminal domain-containing protein n=1 Tax=Eeniella nana TaxID=13502 RepID=A0A875S7B6_EENNA|nr:uncharacterized protein FOA43_003571 [Brettanomyces nanus]QPG76185.1 hypothetical protein FOA43_003571 [Brettanomyces nanus]